MVTGERDSNGVSYRISRSGTEPLNADAPEVGNRSIEYWFLRVGDVDCVVGWFIGGKDYYGVYWPGLKGSPRDFFESAQRLAERLEGKGAEPFPDIAPAVDAFISTENEIVRRTAAELSDVLELDADNLRLLNLATPFGRFGIEWRGSEGSFDGAFITHVEDDEFAGFIEGNCSAELPEGSAADLLKAMSAARKRTPAL